MLSEFKEVRVVWKTRVGCARLAQQLQHKRGVVGGGRG